MGKVNHSNSDHTDILNLVLFLGEDLMSTSEPEIDNCLISTDSSTIRTECAFSSMNYQVIAHLSIDTDLHKLYINCSVSPKIPVIIPVESDGVYLVYLFAIREGMGILDSMPYREVVLQVLSNTTTADTAATFETYIPADNRTLIISIVGKLIQNNSNSSTSETNICLQRY